MSWQENDFFVVNQLSNLERKNIKIYFFGRLKNKNKMKEVKEVEEGNYIIRRTKVRSLKLLLISFHESHLRLSRHSLIN